MNDKTLVERLREQHEQKSAALRNLYGLPVIVTESDTQKGKSALWMDNGMAGCGQVAISTGEFPCKQTDAIGALVNIAAATDYASIAARIEALEADNARLVKANGLRMDELHKERKEAKLWFEQAQEWKARNEALEAALRDAAKAERDGLDAAYLEAFDVHMSLIVTNWPKIKHVPTAIALAAKTMDAMVSFQTLRELPDDVVNAVKEAAKEHTDDVDIDWQEIITALADALESQP